MGIVCYWVLLSAVVLLHFTAQAQEDYANNPIIQRFREYVRINTTTGNDLTPAVNFWQNLTSSQNVTLTVLELQEGIPLLVIKWPGRNPSLNSIMLNSHMDVVPANEEDGWTYPPFDAVLTDEGVIWGRGTQDMKSVSLQYFEALSRLKKNNEQLLRDVYMTLMPDEEIGGPSGMRPFIESEAFRQMNVGFEMDEGAAYQLPASAIFTQDKSVWVVQVDCYGEVDDGTNFPPTNDTATGKCSNVVNRIYQFRDEQYEIYSRTLPINSGGYTSVNLNIIRGGSDENVIPDHVTLTFDIRLATDINEDEFESRLRNWLTEAGPNITLTFLEKDPQSPATRVLLNPYYAAISVATLASGLVIVPTVPSGSTDARWVRNARIPAVGFSPMPSTAQLLHQVNENLSARTFLRGIDIYERIIRNLANIPRLLVNSDPSTYVKDTTSRK